MRIIKDCQPIDVCVSKESLVCVSEIRSRFCYHEDGYLISVRTGKRAGYTDAYGYRIVCFNRKHYREHRIVWALHNDVWPTGFIDHIDRNRADNKIENLQEVPIEGNARNRSLQRNNTSGFTGVVYRPNRNRWVARVNDGGKRTTIGMYFHSAEQANEARISYIKRNNLEYYNA